MLEGAATAVLGGGLGWLATRPLGLGAAGAIAGGLNGLVGGWRGVYDWHRPSGIAAVALDSTWGLVPVTAGLFVHAANAVSPSSTPITEPRRAGFHVYVGGFRIRRGFATAVGNVVTGVAGPPHLPPGSREADQRRRLVEEHEARHVWQSRLFGPLFPLAYGGWMVGGALVATLTWLRCREERWTRIVETMAYYDNPFEWWAYRRSGSWPPSGAHPRFVWGARRGRGGAGRAA